MSGAPVPTRALRTALHELASQFTTLSVPPEVLQLFPRWRAELPLAICEQSPEQLRRALSGIEGNVEAAVRATALDQAVGYAFARSALQAAVVAHDFYGHEGGSQGVSCACSSG